MRKFLSSVAVIGVLAMSPSVALSGEATGALLSNHASVSEISVPLSIDLAAVQAALNAQVPKRLETINQNNVKCVEATWLKTKVPEFRGLKIYSRTLKTKITPDIYCDLRGHVDRRGDISLTGDGNTIRFSLPVHASVTADADVVQETAKADAMVFVDATPGISSDWTPTLDVKTNFRWDKRPTIKLLDLIKITFGSKVEPKLKEEIAKLEAQIPDIMATLDVRGEVETLWMQVQEPVQIAEDPSVYAVFKPTGVGFSGLNVVGDELKAQVAIKGETSVVVGPMPVVETVPLLPLESIEPSDGHFAFAVPAVVEEAELQSIVDTHVGDGITIDIEEEALGGQFSASNVTVEVDKEKGLRVSADVAFDNRSGWLKTIDVFDWFDFSGSVSFEVVPEIDLETNRIFAKSVRVSSETTSGLADALIEVLDMPIVRDELAKLIAYDYSSELDAALVAANAAIAEELVPGVVIDGAIEAAGVENLVVSEGALLVIANATGRVSVQVEELSN